MDVISSILNFIFNKEHRVSSKVYAFIGILILILIIDNVFGFTHYYNINRKLEIIREISEIKKDTALAPDVRNELIKIQKVTLARKNIKERIYNFSFPYKWRMNTPTTINTPENTAKRGSYWIHYLTSNIAFYFFLISVFIIVIKKDSEDNEGGAQKEDKEDWGSIVLGGLTLLWFIVGFTVITTWLFGLIPRILGNYYINYSIQVAINIFIIVSILAARKKKIVESQTTPNAQSST